MTSDKSESKNQPGFFSRRLVSWPLALIGLTLALMLVATSVSAWGRHHAHDGTGDVGEMKSHAARFLDRALDHLDANDEQSAAIHEIVMSTIDELQDGRSEFRSGHDDFKQVLMAESIDREALEALRQSHLARADEMSRTLAANLVDVLELLTPEQRETLEAHFEKHEGRRGHGRWGRH